MPQLMQTIYFTMEPQIAQTEIGCASSDECPTQQACVNALCVDPCAYENPCGRSDDCRVVAHQPVCANGGFCHKFWSHSIKTMFLFIFFDF